MTPQEILERLKNIKNECVDPSQDAYRGRSVWDDSKVMENWSNCRTQINNTAFSLEALIDHIESDIQDAAEMTSRAPSGASPQTM